MYDYRILDVVAICVAPTSEWALAIPQTRLSKLEGKPMMRAISHASISLNELLEIVLMWHTSGDIPMDRKSMTEFIEDSHFGEFIMSVNHWCGRMGLAHPSKANVVKTLYTLLSDSCSCKTAAL